MNHKIDKNEFKKSVVANVRNLYRKNIEEATAAQVYHAVALAVKDMIIDRWIATHEEYDKQDAKIVYYMSMEFLTGRFLGNNIINLCEQEEIAEALKELGFDLNAIEDQERDPALGNGGLGRLAACFLDSLSTLGYPAYGCGIRYRYGLFRQQIKDGYQIEIPDEWLKDGYPFEIRRSEYATEVKFGGYVETQWDGQRNHFVQKGYQSVLAVPYDIPIVGYGNNVVNSLRIWDAQPLQSFNLADFDKGEYQKAVEQENLAKTIVEVLYPNDNHYAGKELRLKQQYFFISASVQRAVKKYKEKHDDIRKFYEKATFHMNDTHPTVAVAELMRILLDEENLGWDEAWEITTKTCAYTNHTIMAEALEKWPIELFSRLLPRIYQIVEEINRRFVLDIQQKYSNVPGVDVQEKIRKMAIIYDGQVKMANMAIVSGYSVNGVARLHTEILEKQELKDFYEMFPERFNNKTNGITQRRFLLHANPLLADWVTAHVGDDWITDLPQISRLKVYADDKKAQQEFMNIKYQNKVRLAKYILEHNGIEVDPRSIFDVQVKRLHEYKRQFMNILHIMYLYEKLQQNPDMPFYPRTFIFGAKASAGYERAKAIIHLINSGAAALDATGCAKDENGQGVMKTWWEMTDADIDACLKATDWCPADLGYFRGGGFSSHFRCKAEMPVTMLRYNIVDGVGPVLQVAEGWTANLPDEVHDTIDVRTDRTWPTTWFAPRLTGEGAFKDVYSVMANWGANHGVTVYGHVGADLITLASMLRIPVTMHNVPQEKVYRPHAWASFGTQDTQAADYAACKFYGPLYK